MGSGRQVVRPYYVDDSVSLDLGDAVETLARLEPETAGCIVTSPPYFVLRDYGVDGQLGAEPSPAEYVEALVEVFRQARRVLAADGTLWLNLGDAYASGTAGQSNSVGLGERLGTGGGHEADSSKTLIPAFAANSLSSPSVLISSAPVRPSGQSSRASTVPSRAPG